jgi:hypothetical protein
MKKTCLAVAFSAMVLGRAIGQQPPNDACQNPTWLQNGINPGAPAGASGTFFTNVGSLGNDVPGFCTAGADTKDVWFTWISSGSGTATVTTSTPPGFTPGTAAVSIEAYAGCGGPVMACSQPTPGGGATLSMTVLNGWHCTIRVATIAPTLNGGTFYLTLTSPPSPPWNDNWLNATPVFPGVNPASGTYTTVAATPDGVGACTTPGEVDVWFRYQPGTSGTASLSTPGQSLVLRVTDPTGAAVVCGTTPGPVSFPVSGGAYYYIRIASQFVAYGVGVNFSLVVGAPGPLPANDECVNAIPIFLGVNGPFPASDGTPTLGSQCLFVGDVWYSFTTGSCPGVHTFTTCGGFSFGIRDSCGNPSFEACGYQGYGTCTTGGSSTWYMRTEANTTHWINVPSNYAHTITISPGIFDASVPITYLYGEITSPFGPGSIQADFSGGPPNGLSFLAVTTYAGTFPWGPAWGIDMTHGQLLAQFLMGPPFTGSFDACGNLRVGPFSGAPSGLTLYLVALGFASGWSETPTIYSYPGIYTIP